jgi:hypothetical protein
MIRVKLKWSEYIFIELNNNLIIIILILKLNDYEHVKI